MQINNPNKTYAELLRRILDDGNDRGDRTGTGTRSLFGEQIKFDLAYGFPLLTTKRLHWKSIVEELLWFLRGETNIRSLQAKGVKIWDEWADENGDLGPVYGSQWRNWQAAQDPKEVVAKLEQFGNGYQGKYIDQLEDVIERIKTKPEDRRLIVSAWNPPEIPKCKLPPCHVLFQFYTRESNLGGRYLDCHMYQRSADVFLGVPYNIASYALLTHMIAHVTGMYAGKLTISFGDVHIYNNHRDQVEEQLCRDPYKHPMPKVSLDPLVTSIDDFTFENINLIGYDNTYPSIKAEVAV